MKHRGAVRACPEGFIYFGSEYSQCAKCSLSEQTARTLSWGQTAKNPPWKWLLGLNCQLTGQFHEQQTLTRYLSSNVQCAAGIFDIFCVVKDIWSHTAVKHISERHWMILCFITKFILLHSWKWPPANTSFTPIWVMFAEKDPVVLEDDFEPNR